MSGGTGEHSTEEHNTEEHSTEGHDRTTETASADYRRAGFNERLGFGERPALIVVDMCRAYFEPGSPLDTGRPEVIEACKELVGSARAASIPVLWTRVELQPGGADGGVFRRKAPVLAVFERGNGELGNWIDQLEPASDEVVVTKQYASGFFDTDLLDALTERGIDTAIICGVSTSGCVRATALDACQNGLVPIVVAEACGDRNRAIHDANLFDLDNKYADVEPLDSVLSSIGASAPPTVC